MDKNIKTCIKIFVIATAVGLLLVMLCFLLSKGELIDNWFYWDTYDTGMDFFHCLEYVRGRDPYVQFGTLYPPLANLLFMILYLFVPESQKAGWPDTYGDSVGNVGSQYDLRLYQSTMLIYIVYIIACVVLLFIIVSAFLKKYDDRTRNLVFAACILSYGMLYCLERGNITFLTLICLLVYVLYYRSSNRCQKELALIALAIAAGLKLYPALFGLLLLKHKDIKAAARAVLYGVCSVVLPCFAFRGGLANLRSWWMVTVNYADGDLSFDKYYVGNSLKNLLYGFSRMIEKKLDINISGDYFGILVILAVIALLLASFEMRKEWMSLLCIVLASLYFQDIADYIYALFLIPLLCLFAEEEQVERKDMLVFAMVLLLVIPLPLFYKKDVFYPRMVLAWIDTLLLFGICIFDDKLELLRRDRALIRQSIQKRSSL